MRALAYILLPLAFAVALYAGAIAPAIDAVNAMSASIAAAQRAGR